MFNRARSVKFGWQGWIGVSLLVLAVLVYQQSAAAITGEGGPVVAAARVKQAWENVRLSSSYAFAADIVIETIPLPTASNIGRFSKTDSLFVEGETHLDDNSLQLAIWGGGVSAADRDSAYQVRTRDGRTETRVGDGDWQTGSEDALAFAPGGDFLVFLDLAQNIAVATDRRPAQDDPVCGALDCKTLAVYTFDLDGPGYARRLAAIAQEQMQRSGKLPPGATAQMPAQLASITGSGELWVDGRGLPVRQKVEMSVPAAPGADNRTETRMDIRFSAYQGMPDSLAAGDGLQRLTREIARTKLPSATDLAVNAGGLSLVLAGAFFVIRPRRRTVQFISALTVALLVLTPLFQAGAFGVATARASDERTQRAEAEEQQAAIERAQRILAAPQTAGPYTPPEAVLRMPAGAAALQSTPSLDSDADGLTDAVEALIGTDPYAIDTDGDTITDTVEVSGFTLGGQQWYGNPLVGDSNGDGAVDGVEWDLANLDRDGDNIPDLYDFDDDGDGVPDQVDISRLLASATDSGVPITFTQTSPLQLTVNGLNPGSYTFVDVQLRPTNPDHLWYAFNVLNWPKDEKGNVQDWDGATFFDFCKANGGANCNMAPDDNGDIKLTPMLEVGLRDLGNLPRTANGALDEALLDKYAIAIQPDGNGGYLAYVPLTLVEDPSTGSKVAFQGQMIYQAGATWTPQPVRLTWTVSVLNEQYNDAQAAKKAMAANGGKGDNKSTLLHAYYDDFRLTGLNVREDRGVDMAIVYEDPALDPAPQESDGLMQMIRGLTGSFFTNRDCDFLDNAGKCVGDGQRDITIATLAQRWHHPDNTGFTDVQRWGIGDYLRVETRSFATQDEATMIAGQQLAPQILDTRFKNTQVTTPTLLYVRETRLRTVNADARNVDPAVTWVDRQVQVNFANETVMALGAYNLGPYSYNTAKSAWEAVPAAAYVNDIVRRYSPGGDLTDTSDKSPTLVEAEATYVGIHIAVNIKGESALLTNEASKNSNYFSLISALNTNFFRGVDITDEDLHYSYLLAINNFLAQGARLVKVIRNPEIKLISDAVLEGAFRAVTKGPNPNDFDFDLESVRYTGRLQGLAEGARKVAKVSNAFFALAGLAGIFAFSSSSKKAQDAGEGIVLAVGAVTSVVDPLVTHAEIKGFAQHLTDLVNKKGSAIPENLRAAKVTATVKAMHGVNISGLKVGAVLAAIGIGVAWVVFFSGWASGIETGSVAFNSLLAATISATLVAVMTLVVSLTVVGAIVLAIFAVFDLFSFIVCKAGVKKACNLGITEAITRVFTDWIYTGGNMIITSGNPPISNVEDLQMRLADPAKGLVAGNSVQFNAAIRTEVRHAAPEPSVVYFYDNFFTREDIQSASVRYAMGPQPQKLKTASNQTQWWDARVYSWVEAEVPSPVVGWLVPQIKTKDLWLAYRNDWVASPVYPLANPQINYSIPLSLSVGLAVPTYNCWVSTACEHKSAQVSFNQDLGKNFVLDILPATVTAFYNWDQLGPQIDPDGDGLVATVDPNNRRYDTDGDGLPDNRELDYGSNPFSADADGDGLNDAAERRYQTNPWRADTDGDGLTDIVEINGYTLTLGGLTVHVTSDPLARDTDKDGMSDGVERRLNTIDAARYPFSPRVTNDPPARLFTVLDDADQVLAPGASATVTTTVHNGTAVENALVAAGVFTASLPAQLGGASQSRGFTLLPATSAAIVLNGVAAAANGAFTIGSSAAADLFPVGAAPTGAPDDIVLDNPAPVIIDNDQPALPALTQGAFVQPGRSVIIGGTASDPTSYIAQVEVSVNGGAYAATTGAAVWAFPVDIPDTPTGAVPITVRAADAVNNTSTASFDLTIDGVSPALTVHLNPGESRRVRRNAAGAWTLPISGTVSDALAGIDTLTVQIGDSSNATYTATVVAPGGGWSLEYAFDDLAFNATARPTGVYTLTVTARDKALPGGNPVTQEIPFVIDMTPPAVALLSHKSEMQLSDGAIVTGTVQDAHSPVQSVEVAFVSARTARATANTLLRLPLNDLPQTVLFANTSSEETRIYCLDASCPSSGVDGADGTAAAFDGNDLLRSFDPFDLPESGLTTALWFKTTCASCGLFSTIQGVYPAVVQHDRELFLDAGKVCSSIVVGATRENRCTAANSYADGQWHQVVHSLGAGGNALYVDGQLAVSSPTTATTFTAQDGVLAGYAPAAATPFLTGALDDIVIYDGALPAESAAALYRQWRPVAFSGGQWAFVVPPGLEGYYQIDMRASDTAGNYGDDRSEWAKFRGPIDTQFPTFAVQAGYAGSGSAAVTQYSAIVRDYNLTTENYDFVCPLGPEQLRYAADSLLLEIVGDGDLPAGAEKLREIVAACTVPGFQSSLVAASACDAFGHCAAALPPQPVAYVGTMQNSLAPFGSLPNAIERTNLSDPRNRVRLLERPGQVILEIAVDEVNGKLYWAEMAQGDYAQPAGIWRANLDGSSPQQLVSGLTVYGAEALQFALDTTGNKLYWTKGHELWWANLDGTLPQTIYSIPQAVPGVSQIGDVVVDQANGRLYFSERRLHGTLADFQNAQTNNRTYIPYHGRKHTLIVTTDLNGAAPEIFAGVGPGCTYANFYDNQGTGTGLGLKPTTCLSSGTDGFDVEAMTVRGGVLYWSAIDADGVNGGVYGRTPGSPAFQVAPLSLTGNSSGLRTGPLPQLYIDAAGVGVFAMLATQIVRGERDGAFTQFASFVDNTPAPAGGTRRSSSTLTAIAVIETAQEIQDDTDLAVEIKSPNLVVVNGGSARYHITLRNDAGLAAADTLLTLALPAGATFAGASRACTDGGATVSCDFGRFPALSQATLTISFTVAVSAVQSLTATVSVTTTTVDRAPANNAAAHSRITAAPSLSALPGLPYLYYGNANHLTRVPIYGTPPFTAEPYFLDPPVAGSILAGDPVRNKLFMITADDKLVAINPDGSGRLDLANANPVVLDSTGRRHVAVDDATGRVYWSEISTYYLTAIKSANPDGSDVQTVVGSVLSQRGLAVDPIRRKLLWVGTDTWQRQEIIYTADLNGANIETIYAGPEGRQVRNLTLDPYTQKLYWLDPAFDNGALFWANADGSGVVPLATGLGGEVRGLVVRPYENAIYYVNGDSLVQAELNGSNPTTLADLSQRAYTGLALPAWPTSFSPTFIVRPSGNLAFVMATPLAAPPCTVNDSHEPNNSAGAATAIGVGSVTGALCTTDYTLPQDIDFYTVTVPDGQQITVTLGSLPADYNLYVQRAGQTLATSINAGLGDETINVRNYDGAGDYAIAVFSSVGVNNLAPYTLTVTMSAAPAQITNANCLAVDPNDAAGLAGNQSQANATAISLGTPATGALCYPDDVDFYTFTVGAVGQILSLDLPVRPADYELHVYRPDGTFFNAFSATGTWTYPAQVVADATGAWAVAVRTPDLTRTTATYQLLVADDTCAVNDSWEPNNLAAQAADISGSSRVRATLCDANDADYFSFSATAGQQLTLNYPASAAGGVLRLLDANGAEVGRVQPGSRGHFTLAGGSYTLAVSNGALSSNGAAYMFQWLLDAPQPAADSYVYYTNGLSGQLYRVALSDDHVVEPIFLTTTLSLSGEAIAADRVRGTLFSYNTTYDSDGFIVRSNVAPFDGSGYTAVIAAPNPDGVNVPPVAIAVDELTGRIYWVQPQGASASRGSTIRSADANGGDVQQIIGAGVNRTSLAVDSIQGYLYWTEDGAIKRSGLDGSDVQTIRAAVAGQQVADLALDPFSQQLYWIDPTQTTLFRASTAGSNATALITGLNADARGVAVQPLPGALYYSSGAALYQARLDGSSPVAIAQLSGAYQGFSNLDPAAHPVINIAAPASALVLGGGTPIVSACALADGNEPNNDAGSATPLTVVTTTLSTYGALCPFGDWDYFQVAVADQKTLEVTLSELPADYRVIVRNAAGLNLVFSDNPGLADEVAAVINTSGAVVTYTILVGGYGPQNLNPYKLTLTLGNLPPPSDADCGYADPYDAPGVGNGALGTATPLSFGQPLAAALCYVDDVDMYAFTGLAGQTVKIDLPTRPQDYTLTLYAPGGTAAAVISATTPLTYGAAIQLAASGRYTVAVAQPGLTPTTDQYQVVVTDENCVASDAYEPNNDPAYATAVAGGSRVRASLCSSSDVDLYRFSAAAGQQLTLNYPANASGAELRLLGAGGELGAVSAGSQGQFTITVTGQYTLSVANNGLAVTTVPYLFQVLLGAPASPPAGSPYLYYSRASDLIRTAVVTGTVEPILLPNTFVGGQVIAADSVRGKLYILDHNERIVQVNPDGSGAVAVVADADPNDVLRFAESLTVDEQSGRIYWVQPSFGVVGDILSANGDGTDVQTVVAGVVSDYGIAIDPVGGRIYWAMLDTFNGVELIRRANLDGSDVQTVYAAPAGREIRDLTVDPFAQTLYWRDSTQNRLLRAAADGGGVTTIATVTAARGFVVRPLLNELYYTAGSQLWRAALDGSSPVAVASLEGRYNGVSNQDANVFYPTTITPPGSNLALAYSAPFAQPCSVDPYEPNNTLATASAITTGTLSASFCTLSTVQIDQYDYYSLTVAADRQISVTLGNLPVDHSLVLIADGVGIGWGYNPGTADEFLTHINRSAAPVQYTILVLASPGGSTSRPYSLTVDVAQAPPPPPPPPPPPDTCAPYDAYDQPGVLGNQTRATATDITVGQTITAALCYSGDKDAYAFTGAVGMNLKIELPVRPADYYVTVYNPAGQYVTGIFPGSWITYGDSIPLTADGRWTLIVWDPYLAPTTAQYQLRLSTPACTGLDPYEPNNEYYSNASVISAEATTLRTMLCDTGDQDWYSFALGVGDRIRITPRLLTSGTNSSGITVTMNVGIQAPGFGFGEITEPFDLIASTAGDFLLGIYTQPRVNENLPYEIDVQITRAPARPTPPNNWTCSVYLSSNVPQPIGNLMTVASTVTVPVSGTVTWVGLKDITFDHGALWNLSFGLGAPDGTNIDLFAFDDYGSYIWCGGSDCHLSLDDWAIPGLAPPQFPNDGGTFRPSRNSFAPFAGKASSGVWTFYVTDDYASDPDSDSYSDEGDTMGDLYGWSLEVCVDNGLPPDPPAPPAPTPAPDPQPDDGAPTGASGGSQFVAVDATAVCTPTVDPFEDDDSALTASLFDVAAGSSAGHTFDSAADADWQELVLTAGLHYTLTANPVDPVQIVALTLFTGTDAAPVRTDPNQLVIVPATSGSYFVRVTSGSGLSVSLCRSNYSLVLTSRNPNALPIELPVGGAALPPGHVAPPRSAAVIAPVDGAVLTATLAVTVAVGLNAEGGIEAAALFVDDAAIAGYTAPVSTTDTIWPVAWAPAQAGVYTLTAVITDSLGVTATSPANVVFVDLAGPAVTVVSETITAAALTADGSYLLRGTASDDSRVAAVEVSLNDGVTTTAGLAQLDGGGWSLAIAPQALANPDGGMLAVAVRATDKAGRTADAAANVLVDITPPAVFSSTVSLVSSGAVISSGLTVTDLNVRLSWPAVAGAASIYAGWTGEVTPTLNSLTAYGAGGGSRDQIVAEGSVLYAHVVAVDVNGNRTPFSQGPFYFDTAATPDLIADLGWEDWVTSGGKQVGQMSTAARGVQKLFAGWDASSLRLRWDGFDSSSEGDLYFYLGVGAGGAVDLFNPAGAPVPGVLPFSASHMVRLAGGITPTLYAAAGGAWVVQAEAAALVSGKLNDVLLPFASLGITDPNATTLRVLAVATQPGAAEVWATAPDQNLGRAWAQYVEFASLGAGIIPAAGVWDDAPLELMVAADPAPAQRVGVGDVVSITVMALNVGSATLPGLTVSGAGTGGLALTNAPQVAANLAPSGTVALTLFGAVSGSGAVALTVADSYHRPYLLDTFTYTVDTTPPVSVTLVVSYVVPGANTVTGYAQDDSPIAAFELEVNGGALTPCTATGLSPGSFACAWDAGSAPDGAAITLRAHATDAHGNAAWSDATSAIVDAVPPVLTFSAATQFALADGRINARELAFSGSVTDTLAPDNAQLCTSDLTALCTQESVLPDNSWTLLAPDAGDGVTMTLRFIGADRAGNTSQALSQTVVVDTVGPTFGAPTVNPGVILSPTAAVLASGTVTDGVGVAGAVVFLVKPDGSTTLAPVLTSGAAWMAPYFFDQTGLYQAVVVATDLAGNLRTLSLGEFSANAMPQPAALTVGVVGSGSVTPTAGVYTAGAVVPVTATAAAGWSFAGWSGDVVSTTNPVAVTLESSKSFTATFTQDAYTVTTAAVGNGVVTLSPAQASYGYGDVVTATATADGAGALFAGWSGAAAGATNPVTFTVDGHKAITATFVTRRLIVHPAQPGALPGATVAISATVIPAQAGLAVSFTVASGGGSLNPASATTDASGRAAVLYTAPLTDTLARIDGMLAAAPAVADSGYLYVAAAAETLAGAVQPTGSGVYTVGNLAGNLIEVVKIGDGAPVVGWSVFAGNPCVAEAPGELITPYMDLMVDGAADGDMIVVTLRYSDTLATRPRPYWCENGAWQPISGTVTFDGAESTLVFTLTNASSPTLFQLQGTPIVGVNSAPTAASVGSFAAQGLADRVQLTWQTLSEFGLYGFHLYRGADAAGPGERITADLLPAQGAGELHGFDYDYTDLMAPPVEGAVYYWLEELRSDGVPVRHGPERVGSAGSQRVFLPLVAQDPAAPAPDDEPGQETPPDSPPVESDPGAGEELTPAVYLPLITQ